jgi:hypothetical protein
MNAHIDGRNVVVTVTGEDLPESRQAARKVACQEAHTATIGKLLKADTRHHGDGFRTTYTWGPVTPRGTRKVATAPVVSPMAERGDDDHGRRVDALVYALGITPEQAAGMLTAATPKVAPERKPFAPIVKAAARKAAAECETCMDLGHVRNTPRESGSVAYRTPKGRDASLALGNGKPCEARGCKAGKAARKGTKAA